MGRMTARSRALRRRATQEESLLWQCLRNRRIGYKIRRQHPLGNFIVDFFCAEARLAIEIDGAHHNAYFDDIRDAQLIGVSVLRFTNSEVNDNVFDVVAEIEAAIASVICPLSPTCVNSADCRRGEGVRG